MEIKILYWAFPYNQSFALSPKDIGPKLIIHYWKVSVCPIITFGHRLSEIKLIQAPFPYTVFPIFSQKSYLSQISQFYYLNL